MRWFNESAKNIEHQKVFVCMSVVVVCVMGKELNLETMGFMFELYKSQK